MMQCRRHNTQKFRTELKPAPVKKIFLDWFFYLSYPLNPRHFYPVNSTSDFCACYVPTKEKSGIRTTRMKLSNTRKCFILSLFYIYFCTLVINTTDLICASLSKLKLISSAMIGSLNLMDLSHWPLGWRSS